MTEEGWTGRMVTDLPIDPSHGPVPPVTVPEEGARPGSCYVSGMEVPRRPRRGYTIIELLIVMVIIAVLAGLAYVKMVPALQRGRVRSAASLLAGDLQYAQILAARNREPIVVTVNTTSLTYQVTDRSGTDVFRTRDLGPNGEYALDEVSATPTTLEVFPNAVAAQSGTYTLGLNGYRRRVTFSRAGQIRVVTVP
jgi:prepilin-type N-terminal cleavage/methylation domain-containing protein